MEDLDTPILTITSKPTKSGPRFYFNIPIVYVKNGQLDPTKTYEVKVFEKEKKL